MNAERLAQVGERVRRFYEACPFPGYEGFETTYDLAEKAKRGIYAHLLDEQLPLGVKILDAGCGTGQLATFLSMTNRTVVGIDFSRNALKKGYDFKQQFGLKNVHFVQTDLFSLGLRDESFDYVFCNGVLHHTVDAYRGFQALCRVVKRGGYLIIGLYNKYGRILLSLRKSFFWLTNGRGTRLDFFMRQNRLGKARARVWFMDQYQHPHEEVFTVGEVLAWFARNNVEYINSVPKINLSDKLTAQERLFESHNPGTCYDHLLSQITWVFTRGYEGGFFIIIGRRGA